MVFGEDLMKNVPYILTILFYWWELCLVTKYRSCQNLAREVSPKISEKIKDAKLVIAGQ